MGKETIWLISVPLLWKYDYSGLHAIVDTTFKFTLMDHFLQYLYKRDTQEVAERFIINFKTISGNF